MKILILITSIAFLFGCSSTGFNRGALSKQLALPGQIKIVDSEIQKALNLKPNLPKNPKIGIYFAPPTSHYQSSRWRWTEEDKLSFLKSADELNNKQGVSKFFQVPSSLVPEKADIKTIRMAAARMGADAVLVVNGVSDIDKYTNNWGVSYLLIVTGLFVPGVEKDALFMTNASLWDVRNEFLYLTAEAEALTNKTYVPAFEEPNKNLVQRSKELALKDLKEKLILMMNGQTET